MDCTPVTNAVVKTMKAACLPVDAQDATKLVNLISNRVSDGTCFEWLLNQVSLEMRDSGQNIPPKMLNDLSPWSVWHQANNNFYTDQLYTQYQREEKCIVCSHN